VPQVIVAAFVAGVAGGITATAFAFAWGAFFTTLIVGGISYIMAESRNPRPVSLEDPGRISAVRQPTAPRRVIYGTARTGGILAYEGNTGPRNSILHLVVMWAGHECAAVEDVFIDDISYTDAKYTNPLISGATDLNFEPWGTRGVKITVEPAGGYVQQNGAQQTYAVPNYLGTETNFRSLGVRTGICLYIQGSASNDGIYTVTKGFDDYGDHIIVAEHIDFASASGVTEAAGASITLTEQYVFASHHLGAADQTADPGLVSALADWTTAHRLRGICYSWIQIAYNGNKFPVGIPKISAVVKGRTDIYDPRTGATGWSDNSALCLAHYLTRPEGLGANYATAMEESQLIAAANVCDESVTLAGGGTAPRYTCNGTYTTDASPEDVIPKMSTAMAGTVVKSGGKWLVLPGYYDSPTIELTDDFLRGPLSVKPRQPRDQLFNAVRGTFANKAGNYIPADFPEIRNATYEAQDNGEVIYKDVELAFTDNAAEAQRIAKIYLEQGRQQIVVSYPANLWAMKVQAGRTVTVTNARFGWSQKPFVVQDWQFSVYQDENGGQALGVDLTLRETAAAVFNWNSGEETALDPSPDTNLTDPFGSLPAPGGLTAASGTSELFTAKDGTIVSRIKLTWDQTTSAYVDAYDVRYRRTGDMEYNYFRVTSNSAWVAPADDLTGYDLGVRQIISSIGAAGPWAELLSYQVVGKTEPPAPPAAFNFLRQQDGTREFQITPPSPKPADLAGYLIRYRLGTGWAWADMTPLHQGILQSAPYETNALAAGAYSFAADTIDTSGNLSGSPLYITADLGDPRGAENSIEFQDVRAEGWPGTKTDCAVDAGILRARNQDTWDTLPATWDAWSAWVSNPVTSFVYEHPEIDLGVSAAFVPLISVNTDSTPTVEINYSTDGTTYSGWVSAGGQVQARYIKVRVSVAQAGTEVPVLSGMVVNLSARPVDESINDLDTSTLTGAQRIGVGDVRLPIQETYVVIRTVQIALQSVGAGWTWDIVDKDASAGPRIRIFDNTGAPADALIDAYIKGL